MSDLFVQASAGGNSTASVSQTLNGVVAGNTIVIIAMDGTGQTDFTVTDSQGNTVTPLGTSHVGPNGDSCSARMFAVKNASSGTHQITLTVNGGDSCFLVIAEIGTSSGTSSVAGAVGNAQASPGTGTDAVTSGSVSASAEATLVGYGNDTSSVSGSDIPTANAGATSRASGTNAAIGAWRLTTRAISAATAATFTAPTGSHNFIAWGAAVLNGGGGGATTKPAYYYAQL